jgi:hypothetical protein
MLCSSVASAQGAVPVPEGDNDLATRPADREYLAKQKNYSDTSVTLEELPPLKAKWTLRRSVRFGGVVPVALCGSSVLHVTFIGPVLSSRDDAGSYERFEILPASEGGEGGNCFPSISRYPGHKGPIHAAIRVRPSDSAAESERVQVVLYNPPSRRDIVLIATRPVGESAWIPRMRIDMPNATRIDLIEPSWH